MKKIGIIVFILAIALGIAVSGVFSFGKFSLGNFSFSRERKRFGQDQIGKERSVRISNASMSAAFFRSKLRFRINLTCQVEADDNLLQYIKTEVDGDTLEISTKQRISSDNPIIIQIGAPIFENIEASGVSRVTVLNLNNDNFKLI